MERKWKFIDITRQLVGQLIRLDEAKADTTGVKENEITPRSFPMGASEGELRKFYGDKENKIRTVFCPSINIDSTDDWGMFGYTPGFIYIEGKRYEGARTLADEASLLGLSTAVDPRIGISVISHFDFFPKHKFEYALIKQSDDPKLFEKMYKVLGIKVNKLEEGEHK